MRAASIGLVVLAVAAVGARAGAAHRDPAGDDDEAAPAQNAELRLDLDGEVDRLRPEDPLGPLVRSGTFAPRLAGTSYLHPLEEDGDTPLSLLPFFQHPGALGFSLTQLNGFADRDGAWRSSRRALGLGASIEDYFDDQTGFLARIDAAYSGLSGDTHGALELTYQASLLHYFRPNLRGELGYVGGVSQSSRTIANPGAPAVEDLEQANNAGQVAAEAVVLDDRLGVRLSLLMGQFTEDRTVTALGTGAIPGDVGHGLLFAAGGTVTDYMGRAIAVGLDGGLRGRTGTTRSDSPAITAASRSTLTPFVGPQGSWFFTDRFFLLARYQVAFPQLHGDGAPSSSAVDQSFGVSVGGRF